MPFSVNDFRANLISSGARPNLFEVQISLPGAVQGEGALLGRNLTFLAQATALPASTLGTIEVPYFGRRIKIPGDREFENWTITVMNDENFSVRHAFEAWHNKLNSLQGNRNSISATPGNYKSSEASIVQYSKAGNPIRTYNFNGVWPVQVSEIELNWEPSASIETFSVTLAYDWYTIANGPAPLA